MRPLARFAPIVALALAATRSLPAAASPVTPTFALQWGAGQGTAPGQYFTSNYVHADAAGNVFVVDSGASRILKYDGLGNFLFEFGSNGFGDGQFQAPYGLATDAAGNIYVTDFTLCRIQKFTSAGAYVTKWGSAGTADGSFSQLRGIAIDAAGSVYVADSGNHRIQKFDAAGNFLTKWGTVGPGNGQFNRPTYVAIDPPGNVYVCDVDNSRIQKFTSNGAYLGKFGSIGTTDGKFMFQWAVAVDKVGNVYVADNGNNRIQKFTADGTYLTQWGTTGAGDGQFSAPISLSVDAEENVYVVDTGNHRIQKFSGAGVLDSRWPMAFAFELFGPSGTNTFLSPQGIGAASSPYVWVAQSNSIVRSRSFTGTTYDVYGSGGSGDGQFAQPSGIATDAAGVVYVADTNNNRIQKLSSSGVFISKWGTAGTGDGQFNLPAAIALDAAGNVFVVDQVNRRIQKFTSTGVFLLKWGSLGSGNGQFDFPTGIAIDRNGNVYVADGNNSRVQKFALDGTYLGQFPVPLGATPDDIAVDATGSVWVPTGNGGWVFRLTTNGLLLNTFNLGAGTVPNAIATDPAGSVYIADGSTARIYKYVAPPTITYASDVAADEGGRVTVRIRPTSADSPNSGVTVLGYDVYMRSGELSPAASPDGGAPAPKLDAYLVPATGAAEYTAVVNTAGDATAAALQHWGLTVRAWTGPYSYYESELHPAMSVDNLPPPVPSPFTVGFAGGGAHLHWGVNAAADFTGFRLYRSADPAFVPGPTTLLAATTDTGYVDPVQPGLTYKLSAIDEHGNESLFATLGPSGVVGVPEPTALAFALEPVRPNPSAPGRALTARFTLPRAAAARLELVDVVGRRVAAREVGGLGAGTHTVDLSSSAGGRALEAGVYFMRLVQGADVAVRRMVVLD